ncbi:MAG: hypothetical protein JSW55_01780 [Chloroflexota bacterium]|nr:MAG: hypothetical protein JSW55_01780 [Chloroflexota bacterium]
MAVIVALAGMVVLGVSGVLAVDQAAPTVAVVGFDPDPAVGVTGGNVDVSVVSEGATNVYGFEMAVSFDPAVLQVVDADPGNAGVQIAPGICPAPDFVASNTTDNVLGNISYAATQLNPTPPCNGGEAAMITFQCAPGLTQKVVTTLTLVTSIISDPNGNPIPHDPVNGTVECEANVFFIDGEVNLQAWPDPSGVQVVLRNDQGAVEDGPIALGSDGVFQFQGVVNNVYSVEAFFDRYLTHEQAGITSSNVGEHVVIGSTSLRTGDINGDQIVNILDISAVAGNFGKASNQPWTAYP